MQRAMTWGALKIATLAGAYLLARYEDNHKRHTKRRQCIKKDKELRDSLSQRKIDQMIDDSFPASDPPSTY